MEIKRITVGNLEENCYLITEADEAAIIDPGSESEVLLEKIGACGVKLTKILLTHGHFDHIGAVCEIKERTGAKIYMHEGDAKMPFDTELNLGYMNDEKVKPFAVDNYLSHGDILSIGHTEGRVYHTPGHSDGSVCFLFDENLFCGDLLFKNSIGRFDRGNLRAELKSLKFLMDNLDDNVIVYPGHGPKTTVGDERRNNPYILNHVL